LAVTNASSSNTFVLGNLNVPFTAGGQTFLSVSALDGDAGRNDNITFGRQGGTQVTLSDALHPSTNFFNARRTYNGQYYSDITVPVVSSLPNYDKVTHDLVQLSPSASYNLPGGTTTATLTLSTGTGEGIDMTSFALATPSLQIPPVAVDDAASTIGIVPVVVNVLANDTPGSSSLDPSTVTNSGLNAPDNGTISINPTTGAITYTANPGFTGTDQFEYRVCDTGSPSQCDVALVTITITCVNPTISLGAFPSVCSGVTSANLPYTGTTGTPNQYSIDYNDAANTAGFADVTNATLTASPIVLVVPGAAAAATYNGTLTVRNSTNGCSSGTYPITVTVKPIPTVTNNPLTQTICSGASTTLVTLTSDVGGTTFAWTATATAGVSGFTANGTGTIPVQTISTTGITQGTVTYAITPTAAGCAGTVTNYTVLVNPKPTVTNNPLTQTICSGASTTLVTLTSNVSGATFAWTATATAGVSGFTANGTGTIPVQTISTTGITQGTVTYAITPTAAGCAGTVTNYTVLVNPRPTVTNNPLTQTICSGASTTLVALTSDVSGTTFAWTATATAGVSGFTANGTGTIPVQTISTTGVTQGTVTYAITPTAAGCAGTVTNYTVLVNPRPTVTNNPLTQTICSGASTTLVTLTSNVSGATFAWTATATAGVSGFTANGTGTIPEQTISTTGTTQGTVTYAITPTAAGCAGTVTNYTVLVNPKPTITLGENPKGCRGFSPAELDYTSVTGSPNQYSIDYDVTAQGQGFVDVTNASLTASPINLVVPSGAIAGVYNATIKVRNSATGCESISYPFTLELVTPKTAGNDNSGNVCVGATTFNLSTLLVGADTGGDWSELADPPTVPLDAGTGIIDLTGITGATTLVFEYEVVSEPCADDVATITLNIRDLPICGIGGPTSVFANTSTVYTYNGGSLVTNYNWTISGNGSISGSPSGSSVTVISGVSSGSFTLSLTVSDVYTCSSGCNLDVTVTAQSLSGNVYNDVNGMNTGNKVDGTGIGTAGATQLFVSLIAGGNVVATVPVASNGTYSFVNLTNTLSYSVILTTTNTPSGQPAPTPEISAGWVNTGEINNDAGNTLTGTDGTTNGIIVVGTVSSTETNVNFGIEQPPVANNNTEVLQANPGGTNTVVVSPALFTGSDFSGGNITDIRITAFPTNATTITINGDIYTSGTFPGGGVTIPASPSGNPGQPILVDPIDGSVTVDILYVTIDNASMESSQATVSLPFLGNPELTLLKTAFPTTYDQVGDVITYTYRLTNSGNVTLSQPWSVTDDKVTVTSLISPATLAPGAWVELTATYTIQLADLIAGSVTNTATGQAYFGDTPVASNQDSETVLAEIADVYVSKEVVSGIAVAGGELIYKIMVTNAGPAQAVNVQINDAVTAFPNPQYSLSQFGGYIPWTGTYTLPSNLATGATYTLYIKGTLSISQCSTVTNTASVSADNDITPGNNNSGIITTSVMDETPPAINCPAPQNVNPSSDCKAAIPVFTPSVSDNCTPAGNIAITQNPAAGTMLPAGTYTITVTAEDASGNSSSCTTSFTVNSNLPAFTFEKGDATCFGTQTGWIKVTGTGGSGLYFYSKDGGTNWSSPAQSGPYTFSGLGAGDFFIKVKDTAGCESTDCP
jgi:hypothetical protein